MHDDVVPVTVVIAARNESANIGGCVDSARWAAEVVVVDHESTDQTAAAARAAGARVIAVSAPTIGAARNAAIDAARENWILVLDADERATAELRSAVARAVVAPAYDAYAVPRRNFFLGREIRHGGWERDRPIRLFRRGMRYDASRVHERIVTAAPVGTLDGALLHYPYPTLGEYLAKLARYSTSWADDQWGRGRRTSLLALIVRPPGRFVSMYLLRMGFLDGARGLLLALLAATSVMAKYACLWARRYEA